MLDARKLALTTVAMIFNRLRQNRKLQKALFNAIRLNRPEVAGALSDDDLRFIAYCLSRREWSRAQILQDLWVCYALCERRDGFFVEFGATNGLKNSNTWLLEKTFGWSGILAEPNPIWHQELAANRNAFIDHRCVTSRSHDTVAFIATDDVDPELSSIADFSRGDHFAELRAKGRQIHVETISLDDLLETYRAPPVVDYLSIDTEGSELDILSAYSFDREFDLISIENNSKTEAAIQSLLESKGYRRVLEQFSQWDGWYASFRVCDGRKNQIVAPAS
ncbi:methyltransferase [Rhizobium sp. R72]|uniref:FkbM family methyltransferase n=1 Tax=unclassified Rhizobium TaxID=2613769 RepID=UPI000B52CA74|nr:MULTISPECIES: FkbM family methyltransferase [unclassified Rhizobium]OWW00108.1 methyltransferase [Rhizobium sp. R72]OWW00499.1 methyltransferase [Rhizobium sp. R711]